MSGLLYAAVDLGGTNITVVLGDATGGFLGETKQATLSYEGPDAVLDRIAAMVKGLAQAAGAPPAALGIGVPGLVDVDAGETRFLPNMEGNWKGVPVRSRLQAALGCPIHILNDARAATLGELVFGHGRQGVESLALFTLGTGVGGGIVLDGKLRLGPLGAAGEIGHMCVQADGPWCGCGSRGCLETLVSGPALTGEGVRLMLSGNAPRLHSLCEGKVERVSPVLLGAAARAGERSAQAVIERAGEWLGVAASNVITTLHPELIVLGGGVAALDDLLIVPMRRVISARVKMFPSEGIRILRSKLDDRAGVYGALAAAFRGGVTLQR